MKSRSGKQLLKYTPKAPGMAIDCYHRGVWDDLGCCSKKDYVHVDCWRLFFGVSQ